MLRIPFGSMGIRCILLQEGRASANTKRIPSGRDLPCIDLTCVDQQDLEVYVPLPLPRPLQRVDVARAVANAVGRL